MKKLLYVILILWATDIFAQGLIPVQHKNGKWGYKYDKNSKEWIIKPQFHKAGHFHYGVASVYIYRGWLKNKYGSKIIEKPGYGYINESGQIILPLEYNFTSDFREGLGRISLYSEITHTFRRGFINPQGQIVIPLRYDYAEDFKDGRALVRWFGEDDHSYECYIDKEGNACTKIVKLR